MKFELIEKMTLDLKNYLKSNKNKMTKEEIAKIKQNIVRNEKIIQNLIK